MVKLEKQKRYMLRLFDKIYGRLHALLRSENGAMGDDSRAAVAAAPEPPTPSHAATGQTSEEAVSSWEEHARKLEATISAKNALIDNFSTLLTDAQKKINDLEQKCTDSDFAKRSMAEKLEEAEKSLRTMIISAESAPALLELATNETPAAARKAAVIEIAKIIQGEEDGQEESQWGEALSEDRIKEILREMKTRTDAEMAEKGRLLGNLAKLREKTQKLEKAMDEKEKEGREIEDRQSREDLEKATLQARISDIRAELEECQAALAAASKRLEDAERDRNALRDQLEESTATLADVEKRREALEEGRRDSEETVEQMRGENARLSEELEGLKA
ncbi:unnamed protein product, partial [Dibothriocephalus latus]